MGEKDEEQELLCPLLLHTINVERNYSWSGSIGGVMVLTMFCCLKKMGCGQEECLLHFWRKSDGSVKQNASGNLVVNILKCRRSKSVS